MKFSQTMLASALLIGLVIPTFSSAESVKNHNSIISLTTQKIAASKPGTILSIQIQTPTPLLQHASEKLLITYRSRGIKNEPIVTSGYILLPKGNPPKGGWSMLAWAHGTTGVADTCAPSGDFPDGPVHPY